MSRSDRAPSLRQGQSGAALTVVMLLVAVATILVVTFSQEQVNSLIAQDLHKQKARRNQVANQLWERLSDNQILVASARSDLGVPGIPNGNLQLKQCIYPSSTKLCVENPAGYDLTLAPDYWYPFNSDVACNAIDNGSGGKISNPNNLYCFLNGRIGTAQVGYDFEGRVGEFSKNFPFLPKVKMSPKCPPQESPCRLADSLELSMTLTHYDFSSGSPVIGRLGSYPAQPQIAKVNVSQLIAKKCNAGAVLVQHNTGSLGSDVCECRAPWEKIGEDKNGPKCSLKTYCDPGMVPTGISEDGSVHCVPTLKPNGTAGQVHTLCVSIGPGCTGLSSVDSISCENVGYVQDITMHCSEETLIVNFKEIPAIDWLNLLMLLGPLGVAAYFTVTSSPLSQVIGVAQKAVDTMHILTGIASALGPFGIALWTVIRLMMVALLIYLSMQKLHTLESEPRPTITCTYTVTCADLRG